MYIIYIFFHCLVTVMNITVIYKVKYRNHFRKVFLTVVFIHHSEFYHPRDLFFPVWWPGKRIVPLLPVQAVKGDQNGYPVPGGIAGPPCPGGYKFGGLALQVGGWATGWQPVTVKNWLLGNLKCGLGTVR